MTNGFPVEMTMMDVDEEVEARWRRALSGRWEDPMLVTVRELCAEIQARCRREAEGIGVESRRRDELCVSAGTLTDLLETVEGLAMTNDE